MRSTVKHRAKARFRSSNGLTILLLLTLIGCAHAQYMLYFNAADSSLQMDDMMINAEANLIVNSLQMARNRLRNDMSSWNEGDCFHFEYAAVPSYENNNIDYSPVREELSCPDLQIGFDDDPSSFTANTAECTYLDERKFQILMLAAGDNAEGTIGPFNNPPSRVSNFRFSSILYYRDCVTFLPTYR